MEFESRQSKLRLLRLIEQILNEEFRLEARGLRLDACRVETGSRLPSVIRLSANLTFLPLGSPFCCMEPSCHLPHWRAEALVQPAQTIQRRLRLTQPIELRIIDVEPILLDDVELDRFGGTAYRTPVPHPIDARDHLGRTALWRAATRSYTEQVEALLEAGADPTIPGPGGSTLLELIQQAAIDGYLAVVLERAIRKPHRDA